MIKIKNTLSGVKQLLGNYLGEDVYVEVNLGRNKLVSYKAKLTKVYPALFTVSPYGSFNGKTSFSYFEYMCGDVKINKVN